MTRGIYSLTNNAKIQFFRSPYVLFSFLIEHMFVYILLFFFRNSILLSNPREDFEKGISRFKPVVSVSVLCCYGEGKILRDSR